MFNMRNLDPIPIPDPRDSLLIAIYLCLPHLQTSNFRTTCDVLIIQLYM